MIVTAAQSTPDPVAAFIIIAVVLTWWSTW